MLLTVRRFGPYFGLILLPLLAYWPCLHGGFIWDDYTFIVNDDVVNRSDGWWRVWWSRESTDFWPLTYTVFWCLRRWFGDWPFGYHLVNLAVHCANAILVWRIFTHFNWRGGLLAAFIFAIHPVNVEAVAWIFQLKTTLSTGLVLGSGLAWLRYEAKRSEGPYALSLFLFILALLTKASVVTWPLIMLGLAWWRSTKVEWIRLAPFFAASLVLGLVNLNWYAYDQVYGGEAVHAVGFMERAVGAGFAFWFYWLKALVPWPLMFVYPQFPDWGLVPALSVVAAFVGAAFFLPRRWVLGLGFFALAIFPALGFFTIYFMRYSLVADHWQYLAILAIIGLCARPVVWLAVPVLAVLTFERAAVYKSEESLWRDTVTQNPQAWLAQNNLGAILLNRGEGAQALTYFEAAIVHKPDFADPYNNIGVYYLSQNDGANAERYFRQALAVFPFYARALNNMAALAERRGDARQAIAFEEQAVAHLPTYVLGYENLAKLYLQVGDVAAAAGAFNKILRLRPDDLAVRRRLESLAQGR